jgi:hypothetical protein
MDNFDLRKYLVENKATTNSRMLEEAANIKDIIRILQAGDFAALAKMPADQKLAQTILNTLKQSQPELLKKLTAYAKKNEKTLAEESIKNTLLGLLMALSLGTGAYLGISNQDNVQKGGFSPVQTTQTTQDDSMPVEFADLQAQQKYNNYLFRKLSKNKAAIDAAIAKETNSSIKQDLQNLKSGNWDKIQDAEGVVKVVNSQATGKF